MLEKTIVFIFGSFLGSFLNVCIHRLPVGESAVTPLRSYCPSCKKKIPWYDNIPFISYLVLRGKCRFCKSAISFRYFLVEFLAAISVLELYTHVGAGVQLFYYTLFIVGLLIASFVDIEHRIIPDEISIGGCIVGIIFNAVRGMQLHPLRYDFLPVRESLLGAVAGGGVIFLVGFAFDIVYFKLLKKPAVEGETSSMGGGDVKLLAMIGAFLGWQKALLTFFLAPFLGVGIALVNLLFRKRHIIPYGPFLSLAAVISMLWGNIIIAMIINR